MVNTCVKAIEIGYQISIKGKIFAECISIHFPLYDSYSKVVLHNDKLY